MNLPLLFAILREERPQPEPPKEDLPGINPCAGIIGVNIGDHQIEVHIRKLANLPAPELIDPHLEAMQAEAIRKAAAAYEGGAWTLPTFYKPTRGTVGKRGKK